MFVCGTAGVQGIALAGRDTPAWRTTVRMLIFLTRTLVIATPTTQRQYNAHFWYWYAQQGLRNGTVSVRLSVCPARPLQQRAAGLLLWARRLGDIDRLLHGRCRSSADRSTARSSRCGQRHVYS